MRLPKTCRFDRVVARSVAVFALLVGTAVAGADSDEAVIVRAEATPAQIVESLHTALLDVMKHAETLGYQGRYDALENVVPGLFDTPFMAEKSVGRYWKKADEEERRHLLKTFSEFMVANYAGNFDGYAGETFETLEKVESTHGTVIVRTRLNESDGDIVQLDYRLREADGRWRIIDIYLNGTVSELALRRSEYSTLIEREGFDSLIVALNQKITDLAE
jgi:phospholipid transport system substrate-binding protein